MKIKKQEIINKIVEQKYKKSEQQLDLYNKREYWAEVLLVRDWSMLKKLQLRQCGITDAKISLLLKFNWSQLEYLSLFKNSITSKGMKLMLKSNFINLKQLSLNQNLIGSSGVKNLVKMDLSNLERVYIRQCGIGNEGIKHLSKAKWLKLKGLALGYYPTQNCNQIKLDGWESMYQNCFKQLQNIFFHVTESAELINCVLMETEDLKIAEFGMEVSNSKLYSSMKKVLQNRNLFNN